MIHENPNMKPIQEAIFMYTEPMDMIKSIDKCIFSDIDNMARDDFEFNENDSKRIWHLRLLRNAIAESVGLTCFSD